MSSHCILKAAQQRRPSADLNKSVGDLNIKLKLELGALRGENEGLQKKNEQIRQEMMAMDNQIQVKLKIG